MISLFKTTSLQQRTVNVITSYCLSDDINENKLSKKFDERSHRSLAGGFSLGKFHVTRLHLRSGPATGDGVRQRAGKSRRHRLNSALLVGDLDPI